MKSELKITHELQRVEGFMDFMKSHFDTFDLKEKYKEFNTYTVSHKDIKHDQICPTIGYNENGEYKIVSYVDKNSPE